MRIDVRELFTTPSGLEYRAISGQGADLLSIQGPKSLEGRVRQACRCASLMYASDPDHGLKGVSMGEKDGMVSAVFEGELGGWLEDFLGSVPEALQYAEGRRVGRALHALHLMDLDEKCTLRARERQGAFMERIAAYVGGKLRFMGEAAAMNALSLRYDHFSGFLPARRFGLLRPQRVTVRSDLSPVFVPVSSMVAADATEDFALMECELAGAYPVFGSGVIDGYFLGREVPPGFWLNFALQCALYSLWHCAREAIRGAAGPAEMQRICQRICADFDSFKSPIPKWYRSRETKNARAECLRRAW